MNSRNLSTKVNKIITTENKQTKLQQENNITSVKISYQHQFSDQPAVPLEPGHERNRVQTADTSTLAIPNI